MLCVTKAAAAVGHTTCGLLLLYLVRPAFWTATTSQRPWCPGAGTFCYTPSGKVDSRTTQRQCISRLLDRSDNLCQYDARM